MDGPGRENICVNSLGPEGCPPADGCGVDGIEKAPVALCEEDGPNAGGGGGGLYGSGAPWFGRLGTPNIWVNSPALAGCGAVGGSAALPNGSFSAGCGRGAGDSTG